MYNYTMLGTPEGMTIEERHKDFLTYLGDGSHFPGTSLKVRVLGMETKSIEITLESRRFIDVTHALDVILERANFLKATMNVSDTEYSLTLEAPRGTFTNILDMFNKHRFTFAEDTILKTEVRDKNRFIFSIRFC